MTYAEAALIMMSGGESKLPYLVNVDAEENSVVGSSGYYMITEHYHTSDPNVDEVKQVRADVDYFGTTNEQLKYLVFFNTDGSVKQSIYFSGYYIG